jgi:hypothetical protein
MMILPINVGYFVCSKCKKRELKKLEKVEE